MIELTVERKEEKTSESGAKYNDVQTLVRLEVNDDSLIKYVEKLMEKLI